MSLIHLIQMLHELSHILTGRSAGTTYCGLALHSSSNQETPSKTYNLKMSLCCSSHIITHGHFFIYNLSCVILKKKIINYTCEQ